MRKLALLSTSLLGVISIAPAHAVDVKLYGQVNKALVGYDDGAHTDFAVVDNDNSSTRFGVKGSQKLDNGMTASVLMEYESQSNPSNTYTQTQTAGQSSAPASSGTTNLVERHAAVGLAGEWGGVTLGKTSTAVDGTFTKDKGGVNDLMTSDFFRMAGGLEFLNDTTNTKSGTSISDMTFDGAVDRDQLVRYDSPIMNGLSGKVSLSQGGDVAVSGNYDTKFAGFDLAANVGVKMNNDLTTSASDVADVRYMAAVTAKHDSGFAGTLAYTTDSLQNASAGAEEPEQWYGKVSYGWDAYEVAADYGIANHYGAVTTADSEIKSYGLGAQYNMGNGVSLSGMYRNYSADVTGSSLQDIDLFVANMRVKF